MPDQRAEVLLTMPTTIEQYPLENRKVMKRFTESMIRWFVLFVLLAVGVVFGLRADVVIAAVAVVVLTIVAAVWQWTYENKYFAAYFYDITPDFLVIKKGWITPVEVTLPYEKLQDVYVDQDIYDRAFNLYDVHVSTATMMSGIEAHIDGVNAENAQKLREMLLSKSRQKKEVR